jgi:hypothetical protein
LITWHAAFRALADKGLEHRFQRFFADQKLNNLPSIPWIHTYFLKSGQLEILSGKELEFPSIKVESIL